MPCNLDIVRRPDVIIVRFPPNTCLHFGPVLDSTSRQLLGLVRRGEGTRLVVNFENVAALGASALGVLVRLRARVRAGRGQLRLCGLRPVVREVFETTWLDTLFDIRRDEAGALAGISR